MNHYHLPDFLCGGAIEVTGLEGESKTMKVLTSKTDYIIGKYDYILLTKEYEEQPPIMTTNEVLNTILPSNWVLVDEYTIVAPITDKDEWNRLSRNAKKTRFIPYVF